MPRFVIVAVIALTPVTFLFDDADKALAKVRTLQRNAYEFSISNGSGEPFTIAELENLRAGGP